ncbi:MAG TPA: hypothetical protein P5346_10065 [Spirochaetota bacterium]|nr:hypothetical protein [Spirochaetota bacterium]
MAQAFLNPVFTSLSGRVGDIVFYGYGGKTYFRSYVKPCNPDTPSQKRNRGLFAEAMKAWRKLSRFDKDSYRRRAGRLGMTGHNLFISRYMRSHAKSTAGGQGEDMARQDVRDFPCAMIPVHVLSRSVCGSMPVFFARDGVPARNVSPPWAFFGAVSG